MRSLRTQPRASAIYGHFMYQAGKAAVRAGRRLGVPSFVGVGEGDFWSVDPIGYPRASSELAAATGFVAVSTPIQDGLIRRLGIPPTKIGVFPNGVDLTLFRSRPRETERVRLGLPADAFIVVFVGTFDELKGGRRLLAAVRGLTGVKVVLLGQGPIKLDSPEVVFAGVVSHELVSRYLSAGDAFVLPTEEEGSCNAAIEAMACGVPIVTSNGAYMDDLVDDEVALRIEPRDVLAIREAIIRLKGDRELRLRMSNACLLRAARFDIDARARRILAWMTEMSAMRASDAAEQAFDSESRVGG